MCTLPSATYVPNAAHHLYVGATHVHCSVLFGAYACVNWAVLHVPRHGDATRVRCVTCFPECLSIPPSAFPCARGAPMLHLFV